jgi:myo-inositol 2-dehydrogenase/D-chiro-inositol 1-dehydrogenase
VTAGQASTVISSDWRARFGAAYTAELQAWVSGLPRGECIGPSAWEGYAATKVVNVGVEAVKNGARMTIDYIDKPALYRSARDQAPGGHAG